MYYNYLIENRAYEEPASLRSKRFRRAFPSPSPSPLLPSVLRSPPTFVPAKCEKRLGTGGKPYGNACYVGKEPAAILFTSATRKKKGIPPPPIGLSWDSPHPPPESVRTAGRTLSSKPNFFGSTGY